MRSQNFYCRIISRKMVYANCRRYTGVYTLDMTAVTIEDVNCTGWPKNSKPLPNYQ